MATATQEKPSVDSIVNALKSQIPNCQVTDQEVANLTEMYPNVAYKDIRRLFYQAIRYKSMQPVSYINRQLAIIHPPADPFSRQISQERHTFDGRKVESGTDWQDIYAQIDNERANKRLECDRTHGAGSFDRAEERKRESIRAYFLQIEADPPKVTTDNEDDYDSWSDGDKQWYDDLVKEVLEG